VDWLTQALLEGHITVTHSVHLPQLDTLGAQLMEHLQEIRDAVQAAAERLNATLSTELLQIATKLDQAVTPEEKQVVVDEITALSDTLNQRIAGIVPDVPPTP
jgi:hypothetical protein